MLSNKGVWITKNLRYVTSNFYHRVCASEYLHDLVCYYN